jgi:anti-sigma-K factor RskA
MPQATPPPARIVEVTPAPAVPTVPAPSAPPAQSAAPAAQAARIEQENRALRARIEELGGTLAAQQAQLAQGSTELQQALARMQSESASAAQALQQEQARAAQLEQRLTAADADRKLAADREARLRESTATRIRQLEGENEKFRRVIDDQQRRIQQNTQLAAFFNSPNLRLYRYEGTRNGPQASAHVVAEAGNRVLFYAFHLPQLPAGRTYQLWLIRGQSPAIVSGGVFQADKDGNAVVEFANPAMLRDVRQFAVTDEPSGGSPGPTGKQFFRAAT